MKSSQLLSGSQEYSLSVCKATFLCSFTKAQPVIFHFVGPGDAIAFCHNLSLYILFSLLCHPISIFASDFPTQILKYPLFFVTPCVLCALPILSFSVEGNLCQIIIFKKLNMRSQNTHFFLCDFKYYEMKT